ncbi:hypothetical protein [Tuwongella immobilis]|uniref:Uncharacterized protein n=1 Tax=Tuwongella immobilis TaxID=692036 RepID=A0A6C2YHE5_9BACT|nr:hypothetical protein [Tuwongella immobilis]VIP00837.1 unnamed protein product [Tuwongella immobilis]VTR97092.1 unnamed protein product [Tuwongella immobilis]
MNQNESETVPDPESYIGVEGGRLNANLLRRFAAECCRRVSDLITDPIYLKLLEFAERRASNSPSQDQLTALRSEATRLYDTLYPGYGSPSAAALALTAVGEAAFTDSSADAAISASSTAAEARATAAAMAVDDDRYDDTHDETYADERQCQLAMLKRLDPTSTKI